MLYTALESLPEIYQEIFIHYINLSLMRLSARVNHVPRMDYRYQSIHLCHSFNFYSFYNWETQTSTSNPTPNYQVIAENASGLLFKNKRDRKILNVDPKSSPGDNSTRVVMDSSKYIQVVIYDHITRRKT